MITTFIITIISLLLGYILGKNSLTKQTFQDIKREVDKKVYPHLRQPSGVIQRPDAKRIYDLNNPQVLEEKEEMSKTLDKGIEPLTP